MTGETTPPAGERISVAPPFDVDALAAALAAAAGRGGTVVLEFPALPIAAALEPATPTPAARKRKARRRDPIADARLKNKVAAVRAAERRQGSKFAHLSIRQRAAELAKDPRLEYSAESIRKIIGQGSAAESRG